MEHFQTIGAAAGLFTLGAWTIATIWALAKSAGKQTPTPDTAEDRLEGVARAVSIDRYRERSRHR